MKRMLSGLMPAIAVLACLAAWVSLREALPHCVYCYSTDIRFAPTDERRRRHECLSCGCEFVWVDDTPFGICDAVDALSRPRELYAR